MPTLARVVTQHTDTKLLTDSCWTLYYLTDGGGERLPHLLGTPVVPRLVELLLHPEQAISIPSLRILGNITTGTDEETQIVMKAGILGGLKQLLASPIKSLRKEACWVLSNIAAGTSGQVDMLLAAELLPQIVHIVHEDSLDVDRHRDL